MTDDELSKQAGKAFQNVALGLAGAAGGAAGVALTVGASALFNIFDAVANANTEAFQQARIAALEDDVLRVRDEVKAIQERLSKAGKPMDPPDAPTQARVFSDFAEAVAKAATPEKRTALVHAAARQFDPEVGPASVRKYWFDQVRQLSDVQVAAIRLLVRYDAVIQGENDRLAAYGNQEQLALTDDEHAAFRTALVAMTRSDYVRGNIGSGVELTFEGDALARYITG